MTIPKDAGRMEMLVHQYRKSTIEQALTRNENSVSATARDLGTHRYSLYRWIKLYNIKVGPWRRMARS